MRYALKQRKLSKIDTIMVIRPATPADIPQVLPMVAKVCALHESWDAAKYGFLPNPDLRYERWLSKLSTDEQSVFLVAESEATATQQPATLVAFLVATIEREIPLYRLGEFAFIHDIWVEPEYRQAGIAKAMLMQTINSFGQRGIKQIRLDTALANEAARRLFASCGFRLSTMEMLIELN